MVVKGLIILEIALLTPAKDECHQGGVIIRYDLLSCTCFSVKMLMYAKVLYIIVKLML